MELLQQLPDAGTNAAETRAQLALSFYYQGLVQFDRGESTQAHQSFAEYLRRVQAVADDSTDPNDSRVLQSLAIAHGHLGRALLDQGEAADALDHFLAYARLAENLERLDPGNVNYQKELGFSLAWLAEARDKTAGSEEEIARLLRRSSQLFRKLARQFPQGDFWQDQSALAVTRLAVWFGHHHHSDQARQLLAEELTTQWNVLRQFSGRHACHARFIRALGWSEDQVGPTDASPSDRISRLQNWVAQAAREAAKPGAQHHWDWTLGTLHSQLANAHALQGNFASAKRELESALPSWQRLAQQHRDDPEAAAAVVRTFCGISVATLHGEAPAPAILALRPLLDWLKTNPPSPASTGPIADRLAGLRAKLPAPQSELTAEQAALLKEFDQAVERLKAALPSHSAAGP
jgi:hypothetical protein